MRKNRTMCAIMIIMMCAVGCATDAATNAYRSLAVSKEFRASALESVADLYKDGLISDAVKAQAIKLGDDLANAQKVAVDALVLYEQTKQDKDKTAMQAARQQAQLLYQQFVAFVTPLLQQLKGKANE